MPLPLPTGMQDVAQLSETKQLDSIGGQELIWSAARDYPTSRFIEFNKAQHNKKWKPNLSAPPTDLWFVLWPDQPVLTGYSQQIYHCEVA